MNRTSFLPLMCLCVRVCVCVCVCICVCVLGMCAPLRVVFQPFNNSAKDILYGCMRKAPIPYCVVPAHTSAPFRPAYCTEILSTTHIPSVSIHQRISSLPL